MRPRWPCPGAGGCGADRPRGVAAAIPLAAGGAVGDVAWPLLAMLGLGVLASVWAGLLGALRLVGAAILIWMGVQLVRKAEAAALRAAAGTAEPERPLAGVLAGVSITAGNPKAILFGLPASPAPISPPVRKHRQRLPAPRQALRASPGRRAGAVVRDDSELAQLPASGRRIRG
ncbi:MAG: LysE family transporter [Amaricoccus sp.]|uniref:LysE family translocator n=1 Tax=Amaricoccus sp. TaxID=1872485 RepID=UPI0039E4F0CF